MSGFSPLCVRSDRSIQAPLVHDERCQDVCWLPDWALEPKVRDYMLEVLQRPDEVSMGCVVGPAIPWAFLAGSILWGTWLMTPFLAYRDMDCPGEVEEGIMPPYDTRLWLVFLPLIAMCLAIELKCLKFFISPILLYIQADIGVWKTPLCKCARSFKSWLFYNFGMSMINHLDLITNGLFLAKVWKMWHCPDIYIRANEVWMLTLEQSWVPSFLYFEIPQIIAACWILMVLQLIWALLTSVPVGWPDNSNFFIYYNPDWQRELCDGITRRNSSSSSRNAWELKDREGRCFSALDEPAQDGQKMLEDSRSASDVQENQFPIKVVRVHSLQSHIAHARSVDYKIGDDFAYGGQLSLEYRTVLLSRANHYGALQNIAEATRMSSITANSIAFLRHRVQKRFEEDYRMNRELNYGHKDLNVVRDALLCGLARFVLVGLFENAVMLNMQITLLAIDTLLRAELDKKKKDFPFQQMLSILASIAVGLKKFCEAFQVVYFAISILSQFKKTFHDHPSYQREIQSRKNILWAIIIFLGCSSFGFGALILYGLAKLIAVVKCEDSLWNLSGCVDFREDSIGLN